MAMELLNISQQYHFWNDNKVVNSFTGQPSIQFTKPPELQDK